MSLDNKQRRELHIHELQKTLDAINWEDIDELESACLTIYCWMQKTPFVKGYCRT